MEKNSRKRGRKKKSDFAGVSNKHLQHCCRHGLLSCLQLDPIATPFTPCAEQHPQHVNTVSSRKLVSVTSKSVPNAITIHQLKEHDEERSPRQDAGQGSAGQDSKKQANFLAKSGPKPNCPGHSTPRPSSCLAFHSWARLTSERNHQNFAEKGKRGLVPSGNRTPIVN